MPQASRRTTAAAPRRSRARLRFIASVRFADGHCQRFSVDNACDHAEARRMVFEELEEVVAVVIADYR